jgi:hypothetical protein
MGFDLLPCFSQRRLICGVARKKGALTPCGGDFSYPGLATLCAPPEHGDTGASLCQTAGNGPTQYSGAADDDGDIVLQIEHTFIISLIWVLYFS